jgi:hypothetical protein
VGVIQIRRAQEKLQNFGNVRMVDTSGIAKSSAAGLETIGRSVAGLGRDMVAGMNSINELIERDHERQANKAAEQFRKDLDRATTFAGEFVTGIDGSTKRTGEGLFVRVAESEDEAAKFKENMDTAIEKAKADIKYAEMNADVRRRFDEKTFGYVQGKWNEGNRLATARWEKSSVEHANAGLKNAIADVILDQSQANVTALENALTSARDANHWTDETFALEKRKTMQSLAMGVANKAIAEAATSEDLDRINEGIINIGVDKPTPAQREGVSRVFGDINPNVLPTEQRVALQDAIRRKRANLVQVQSTYVTGLEAQYLEGKIDINGLVDARNKMYDKEGKPLADISSINRLDKLIATAQTKADNEAVEAFMVNAVRTNPDDKTLDILVDALPATVRDSLRVANFVAQAKAGNAKAVYEAEQEARRIQLDQVVYNRGAVKMSLQDRQAKLDQMFAEGRLTGDQWKQAQDKIKVESDVRTRGIAVTALKMAEGGLWGAERVIRFDANGYDMLGTSTQAKKRSDKHGETFAKVFDEYYTEWVKLVNENPTWTAEECKQSFFTTMKPVLDAYTENALQFKGKQWDEARATLTRLRNLNALNEKRKGWDMSVDDIGKGPLNIEFKPVGGNRSKSDL